jgi:hypothetical protein
MKQDQEARGGTEEVAKRMKGMEKYNIKKRKRVLLLHRIHILLFGNSVLYNI